MIITHDWCEHQYELSKGLHLKSISTREHGIEAKVHLICPGCGHTEYMTLRTDFRTIQSSASTVREQDD